MMVWPSSRCAARLLPVLLTWRGGELWLSPTARSLFSFLHEGAANTSQLVDDIAQGPLTQWGIGQEPMGK